MDHPADGSPYAILSHTWDADGEQSYQDICRIHDSVHVRASLCRIYFALLWFLATSLAYFLRCFALAVDSRYLNDMLQLQERGQRNARHAPINRTCARIMFSPWRVLSTFRAWSISLAEVARTLSPLVFPSTPHDPRLSEKLRKACAAARADYFSRLWVDSSCIDKTSSAELSEAINSMYAWYRDAAVCYAYLQDVSLPDDPHHPESAFCRSRWFTRGWTLQELIAPRVVIFMSQQWEVIGTKESLADVIEAITGIDRDILTHRKSPDDVCVAARMSWAASRSKTRVEDEAYCLMGIFGIVMTPIYGEGDHAFRRLQEEILKCIPDDTIFAHEEAFLIHINPSKPSTPTPSFIATITPLRQSSEDVEPHLTLLAPSPRSFLLCRDVRPVSRRELHRRLRAPNSSPPDLPYQECSPTPYGLRIQLPLIPLDEPTAAKLRFQSQWPMFNGDTAARNEWYIAILCCEYSSNHLQVEEHTLARLCYSPASERSGIVVHAARTRIELRSCSNLPLPLSITFPTSSSLPHTYMPVQTVYLPRPIYVRSPKQSALWLTNTTMNIMVPRWTKAALRSQGYHVECPGFDPFHTSQLSLSPAYLGNPLILRLRKDGQEAAVFAPVRPPLLRTLWTASPPSHDNISGSRGHAEMPYPVVFCRVVSSQHPEFNQLTSWKQDYNCLPPRVEFPDSSLPDDSTCLLQNKMIIPVLIPMGPCLYELRIHTVTGTVRLEMERSLSRIGTTT